LIHAGVGEEKVRRARQQTCRGHNCVPFFPKKIQKRLPDLGSVHDAPPVLLFKDSN
jgi:hypothetical protein